MTTNPPASGVRVRPYSIKELCNLYGICRPVLTTWLKPFQHEIGVRQGKYYTVKQVIKIFRYLGPPDYVIYQDEF